MGLSKNRGTMVKTVTKSGTWSLKRFGFRGSLPFSNKPIYDGFFKWNKWGTPNDHPSYSWSFLRETPVVCGYIIFRQSLMAICVRLWWCSCKPMADPVPQWARGKYFSRQRAMVWVWACRILGSSGHFELWTNTRQSVGYTSSQYSIYLRLTSIQVTKSQYNAYPDIICPL